MDVLLNTIAEPVEAFLDFVQTLHRLLGDWVRILPYHSQCVLPAEAETNLTRFNHLVRITPPPSTEAGDNCRGCGRPCSASPRLQVWSNPRAFFPRTRSNR